MATISVESTKERIVSAAGPIFAEKGYRLATIREIAESAEANVAAINYHFGDKAQLYLEVVKSVRSERARQFPIPDWPAETEPQTKLYDFVAAMLNRIAASQSAPWQVKLIMREVLNPSDAGKKLVSEYFQPVFELLLSIIDELAGVELEPEERQRLGYSVIGQCLFYRYASGVTAMLTPKSMTPAMSTEQLALHITQFSIQGILAIANSPQVNTN